MTTAFTNKEPLFSPCGYQGQAYQGSGYPKEQQQKHSGLTSKGIKGGGRNFHFQLAVMRQCLFHLHIIKKDLFKTNPQTFQPEPEATHNQKYPQSNSKITHAKHK